MEVKARGAGEGGNDYGPKGNTSRSTLRAGGDSQLSGDKKSNEGYLKSFFKSVLVHYPVTEKDYATKKAWIARVSLKQHSKILNNLPYNTHLIFVKIDNLISRLRQWSSFLQLQDEGEIIVLD